MHKNKIIQVMLVFPLALFFCEPLFGETIVLKSGKAIEGKITEKTDNSIKIDFYGVALTYFFDEIVSIDGKEVGFSHQTKESNKENIELAKTENIVEKTFDNDCFDKVKQMTLDGTRYVQKADFQEAIEIFNKGLELCKKCFPLQYIAQEHRKKIIPLYGPIYLQLSGSYIFLKEYEKGISICENATKEIPEFAYAFNDSIALAYAVQGKYQKAIEVCESTLKLFPESGTTYNVLGRIYYQAGDYQKAKDNLRKSLEIIRAQGDTELAQEIESDLNRIP